MHSLITNACRGGSGTGKLEAVYSYNKDTLIVVMDYASIWILYGLRLRAGLLSAL